MEQAWQDYNSKLRARMSNLIDKYANPPAPSFPNGDFMNSGINSGIGHSGIGHSDYSGHFGNSGIGIPPVNYNLELGRVPSPALDRLAKNIPEIIIDPITMMPQNLEISRPKTQSNFIKIICWIVGIVALILLVLIIYFSITMPKLQPNGEEEEDEIEIE
jgi:hypothetical protein